ncbi:MAG TPA: DUF4190 domain-containing protein [Pyrinomonadaceae bacterium]|nr:DUF4190 domain-containing protein [Pyrinomonadaceae bacterium]
MKYCPQCKRQFSEAWLSFCSDDGTPLVQDLTPAADPNWDPRIREPKVQTPDEQATQWLPREPPIAGGWIAPDERPPMSPGAWQPPPPPLTYTRTAGPSQNLAMASMIVGLSGILLSWCFGPVPGIVALVLGLVALSQIKKSPEKYSGKNMAIAGIVIGAVNIAFYILLVIFWILASALS